MSIGRAIVTYGEHETESFNEGVGQECPRHTLGESDQQVMRVLLLLGG